MEEGLAYFRDQAEKADPETVGPTRRRCWSTCCCVWGGRRRRRRWHASTWRRPVRPLTCPGIVELCDRVKDYRTLAEAAREQGDPVQFVAGLLAGHNGSR